MSKQSKDLAAVTGDRGVDVFLKRLAARPSAGPSPRRGRLMFALDATASRQPTWDRAAHIQGEMFLATATLGGLAIQLCFYRGFGEFRVSPWLTSASDLLRMMTSVTCHAGETQIGRVLKHAANEAATQRLGALVFVGDCVEEPIDGLAGAAGRLGALGVPAFMFHEGRDAAAERAFREIARLTGGAYCQFDGASPDALRDLLRAVAVFAAGGRPALRQMALTGTDSVKRIASQVGSG